MIDKVIFYLEFIKNAYSILFYIKISYTQENNLVIHQTGQQLYCLVGGIICNPTRGTSARSVDDHERKYFDLT